MSFSISGKTAIVTGAANGVGLAIARHFANRGANVMCADMDEARLIEEFGNNPERNDESEDARKLLYFSGDLRERLTIANLLSATLDAFERVDILVNASRQFMTSDPLDMNDRAVETLLNQNLLASLRLSQLVAKRMIAQGEDLGDEQQDTPLGAIVNLSSIAATRTQPDLMAFSVACAALDQMTRSLAVALAPHRIRVNAVSFGSVNSASLIEAVRHDKDIRDKIVEGTPLGRIASAGELAETVRFLASDGAGFMTGHILTVDGGRSLVDAVTAPAH